MDSVSFIPCPDPECDAPAEVIDRVPFGSTAGHVEHVRTRCVRKHMFFMPTPADLPAHSLRPEAEIDRRSDISPRR